MTKAEVRAYFEARGWKADRFGHLHKVGKDGSPYRIKLGKLTARYEVKAWVGQDSPWIRLRSGYYGKLSLNAEGKIVGFKK
jgi:hypothetical protein